MEMYTAKVEDRIFELTEKDISSLDMIPMGDGSYHLIQNGKKYTIEVVHFDERKKQLVLSINHSLFEIGLEDKYDRLVDQMGLSKVVVHKMDKLNAPMPGLVLDIMIKEGDEVEVGDPLLILEAMKMENVIKASGKATVKKIHIKKGDAIEKSQTLVDFE